MAKGQALGVALATHEPYADDGSVKMMKKRKKNKHAAKIVDAPLPLKCHGSNDKTAQIQYAAVRAGVEPFDKNGCRSSRKKSTETTLLLSPRKPPSVRDAADAETTFGFRTALLKGESGFLFSLSIQMVRLLSIYLRYVCMKGVLLLWCLTHALCCVPL